jgi:Txe/YoeB family toxin of Txe-Axe toxin-antitoxin module
VSKFVLRQKEEFDKKFATLPIHLKKIVNDKIVNVIQEKPFSTEELSYELTGLWSHNDMKNDVRTIYAVCGDCRKKKATAINDCVECGEMLDNTIMLWDLGNHSIYDQLKLMREKAWRKFVKQKRREKRF